MDGRMNISRYCVYYATVGAKVFFEQSLNTVKEQKSVVKPGENNTCL